MAFIGTNLDLLTVGLTTASIGILSFVVYFNNRRSVTNQAFLFFSLVTIVWGWINYLNYQIYESSVSLFLTRMTLYFAVWHVFGIFNFFYVFPNESITFNKFYKFFFRPLALLTSVVVLTPLALGQIIAYLPDGRIAKISNGPGMALFGFTIFSFVISAFVIMIKKITKANKQQKKQLNLILIGTILTFALLLTFNFILPSVFSKPQFIPYGMTFILPFILFTAYAIIKYGLFNIKVVTTELLVFILAMVTLLDVVITKDLWSILFRIVVFILVLIFGIFLIRSVNKEVKQREELALLAHNLEKANLRLQQLDQQKTEFLSIASHQLRTPLTIISGYIELIEDGAYGKVNKKLKETLNNMDESNDRLMKLVEEFLDVTRIEQGRTKFIFVDTSINELISSVVKELSMKPETKDKKLKIIWHPTEGVDKINMDEEKIRHVVFNFLDNAIKYSDKGSINISVEKEDGGYSIKVKDYGFGFEKEDEVNFFQKFYRGKNVQGTNVNGMGLGIYVCRRFIEKHGGHVWAHSPGLGKGSEFGFWIPDIKGDEKRETKNENSL
ncbi:MAG: hypothetical protein COY69_00390 [Candidatus Magasanikbacteria bacterium CG_4_10_14_0_8_um_filter_32_14]|uniref:histidine kinase n=1 Tax=Candidatus Magasanikbacteria bacterium CG_4_10_14_0_8_um_filter_32_14 TaxID=1974640 RepID=A0A2M7RBI5_9BACT|nr:MAG: hypothetical protein COY69_00390 [Candidatus Magasanikbacteria bacterium CG_4_10_14_0_8_um_filter_32_14]